MRVLTGCLIGLVSISVWVFVKYLRALQNLSRPIHILKGRDILSPVKIISKKNLTHNSILLTCELPPGHILGSPTGNHIRINADISGKSVRKSYTPISVDDVDNCINFAIRVYHSGIHPDFPQGGKMSQYLNSLNVGDTIHLTGPHGKITYMGCGTISFGSTLAASPEIFQCNKIIMICGGSGITPMFQILRSVYYNNKDLTQVTLIYGNRNVEDIMLSEELNTLYEGFRNKNLKIYNVLSGQIPQGWTQGVGFITEKTIKENCPGPNENPLILLCGPPIMVDEHVPRILKSAGYVESRILKF